MSAMTTVQRESQDSYEQVKNEIERGLVLRLDPEKMKLWGAKYMVNEGYQIRGPHYFACIGIGHTNDLSFWVPMSSRDNGGEDKWYRRAYVEYGDKWGYEILGRRNNLHLEDSGLGGKAPCDDFLSRSSRKT